jgi:hypothetical protein
MAPSGLPIPQVNHIELRCARRGLHFINEGEDDRTPDLAAFYLS